MSLKELKEECPCEHCNSYRLSGEGFPCGNSIKYEEPSEEQAQENLNSIIDHLYATKEQE